jgi:hypothetical protein
MDNYAQPKLDALMALSKPAYEAYLRLRDGFELWHCQSSWKRKERWLLHRGPMMGGEDQDISNAAGLSLISPDASLPLEKDTILNGWVVRYRLTSRAG